MKQLIKNRVVVKLLIFSLITTTISYIILPFFSIYLISNNKLSIFQAGIIISTYTLFNTLTSTITYKFYKRFNPSIILRVAILTIGIIYISIVYINNFYIIFLLAIILGISQSFIEPIIKILLSKNKGSIDSSLIFRVRYMILCISIIIGPIIGNFIAYLSKTYIFIISGVLYILLSFLGISLIINKKNLSIITSEENNSNNLLVKNKNIDITLSVLIFTSILVFAVFAVFETVTPLSLSQYTKEPEKIFSILIILNSILALLIQPIIIFISNKITDIHFAKLGCIIFALAYIIFSFSKSNIILLITATIVFTFGEAMIIPSIDIIIDKIAPIEKKTLYFSYLELRKLGFFITPIFCSFIIQYFSPKIMYIITSIICISIIGVYNLLLRKSNS